MTRPDGRRRHRTRPACWLLVATLLAWCPVPGAAAPPTLGANLDGAFLYRKHCAPCHGADGRGDGRDAHIFLQGPRDLRQGFLDKYTPDEVVRRVRDGMPLNITLDPAHLQARAREVETLVTYLHRLPVAAAVLAGSGRDLYTDRCAVCHGPYGSPGVALPAGVRRPRDLGAPDVQAALTDAELDLLVRHGREGMPGLTPRVSESDAHALAAFVRLFSRGFELYDRYCAACHGDGGRGSGSFAESFRAPTVVFDRAYFERTDPEHLRKWVWHMAADQRPSMPHYHWTLTQREADAIVEFLRSPR